MQAMLTPEDSKRVADAIIEMIGDCDINSAVYSAIRSIVMPRTDRQWKEDWFPLTVEDMCDKIMHGVIGAAQDAADGRKW